MKILFALSASVIDKIINGNYQKFERLSYSQIIEYLYNRSLFQSFSLDISNTNHALCVFNSAILNKKLFEEKNITVPPTSENILTYFIEEFKPDIIYSNNPEYFSKERFNGLPNIGKKVLWRAAPIYSAVDLSHFDLGLSYASIYLDYIKTFGIKNTDTIQFHLKPDVFEYINSDGEKYDLSFCGSYHQMFVHRNNLILELAKNLGKEYQIRFFLNSKRSFKNLLPGTPFKLWKYQSESVFLEDYLSVIKRSKITFNCHSDFSKEFKGNMRVFETFAMKSLLLTDKGVYPDRFKDGFHYVSYNSPKEMVDKAKYFLKNEKEREEIAGNGYSLIMNEYSLSNGVKKLHEIFSKLS